MSDFENQVESLMCAPAHGGLPIKEARELASKFGVAPRSLGGNLRTRDELKEAILYSCGAAHDQKGGARKAGRTGKSKGQKKEMKKKTQSEGKIILEEPVSRSMILGPLIKALPGLRKQAQADTNAKLFMEWREDPGFSRADPVASGHLYLASIDQKAVDAAKSLLINLLDNLMQEQAERMMKKEQKSQDSKTQKRAAKAAKTAPMKTSPMKPPVSVAKQVKQLVSREPTEDEIIILEMILESLGEPEFGDEVEVGESTFQWSPEGWVMISA